MSRLRLSVLALLAVGLAGCSPTLDWREFVPEGTDLRVAFPCRPDRHARSIPLAGATVRMEMLVCAAAGSTFAVSFADVVDPARVADSLVNLRDSAIANLRSQDPRRETLRITGMTPNPQAVRVSMSGTLPDGTAAKWHAAFFARGLRVYQATVIGAEPVPQAVDTFFAALRFTG